MDIIIKYKLLLIFIFAILFIVIIAFILTASIAGDKMRSLSISEHSLSSSKDSLIASSENNNTLKVMTLNIAHGRKDGANQILQSTEQIKANLDTIASMLKRERPDLVALQEADGPSIWSGNFSHVAYLAEKAGYSYSVRGAHVDGMKLSYGTAFLSKYPLNSAISTTFKPSPPTFSKGFVLAHLTFANSLENQFVSVHLDFSRDTIRQKQIETMIETLSVNSKPLIIMGDFNCDWKKQSALQILANKLNLSAYQPDSTAENMITFPFSKKRLDWILLSKEFEFVSYKVIPDIVSDHLGVIAEIRKK